MTDDYDGYDESDGHADGDGRGGPDDGGNAILEFVFVALIVMVPLVYLIAAVATVQRTELAVTQAARLHARGEDPWARHLMTEQDLRSLSARIAYLAAWTDAFAQTDTRWAPWTAIDAGDMQAGVIASLDAVAAALAKAVPAEPPVIEGAGSPAEQFA